MEIRHPVDRLLPSRRLISGQNIDGVTTESIPYRLVRLTRPTVKAVAWWLAVAGCEGTQQAYYAPCDEPAAVGLGCEGGPPPASTILSASDACLKLARCGVLPLREHDQGPDDPSAYERCVDLILDADGHDPQHTVRACITEASCPELGRATDEASQQAMPDPRSDAIEGVLGFCGRLDSR